jgi:hypothetical protein
VTLPGVVSDIRTDLNVSLKEEENVGHLSERATLYSPHSSYPTLYFLPHSNKMHAVYAAYYVQARKLAVLTHIIALPARDMPPTR